MFKLPPVPSWSGFHPLVVHFPIALLLVVPLLIALAILMKRQRKHLMACSLLLLILGTIATYVAVETGEAAARLADKTPEVVARIETHSGLAENSRMYFSALTVLLALLVFLPALFKRELEGAVGLTVLGIYLCLYLACSLLLANTAHAGARLVHEFGVHALI